MNDGKHPPKLPHLHVMSVEGLLGEAIAITGNATALLQLRAQIEQALRSESSYPLSEATYHDVNGIPFELVVKWAKSKEEAKLPSRKAACTNAFCATDYLQIIKHLAKLVQLDNQRHQFGIKGHET